MIQQISFLGAILISSFGFTQDIKTNEENVSFQSGSHSAIVVTIPYGNKDVVEKELRSELKDWGGKYNSSKGEYSAMQASMKSMGDKYFDGYAKILNADEKTIQVAFAVDLGGAYMNKSEHGSQYKAIEEKVKKFALRAATESIDGELAVEAKILRELEKDKSESEKNISNAKSDIEDYKKRISEAEQKIKDNESAVSKKTSEIGVQSSKIADIEKKKKGIK